MLALSPYRARPRARARTRSRPCPPSLSSSPRVVRRDALPTSRRAVPACYLRDEIPKQPSSPFGAEFSRRDLLQMSNLLPGEKRDALLTSPAKWAGVSVIGRVTREARFGRSLTLPQPHPTALFKPIISNPKPQYHEPPTRNPNLCRRKYPQK
jgi:hypothetical protein